MEIRNVVIVGSGCAGHTSALYTARANLKPLLLEGHEPGGQLSLTTLVENFPGFPDGVQGPELIENMRKQASRFGAEYRTGHVLKADLSKKPFELTIGKEVIQTRTLIIATGASARWLGLPNEQALIGHGVSSCATCDGFFFSGKEIAVVGGGDSAMEEATFLTRFAAKVTLIHRREQFRASKIMLQRAQKNSKIRFLTDTVVDDVLDVSKKEVTALRLRNLRTGASWDFPTSAVFLGIGHVPNAKIFEGQLDTDADGYLTELSKSVIDGRGEAVGINYVASADKAALIEHLERCTDQDFFERGMESAMKEGRLRVQALDISDCFVVEVDFVDDLECANTEVSTTVTPAA